MLDWLIRNWWRWVGLVLITTGLWYCYQGIEIDDRHDEALHRIDERLLEIDKEIQSVENEVNNAESFAKLVSVSAKLVKLEKTKSQFQHESMVQVVVLYTERRMTYIKSLIFEVAALLVAIMGRKIQSRWKRWRNRRRYQEDEVPCDE